MTETPRKIALAGIGKIARDAHIPAIRGGTDWVLAATISRNATVDGVASFTDMDGFLADSGDIDCVALALPPGPRFDYARQAIAAGLHVMLEKPPGSTVAEAQELRRLADAAGVTLYASWHSRMGAAVEEAARRLAGATLRRLRIDWREDVNDWHPGQDWVWDPGSLGVLDPGINAISILVAILDQPVHLTRADLHIPAGRATPIAADLFWRHPDGADVTARLDWRHRGEAVWDIHVETDRGDFKLARSGSWLEVEGERLGEGMQAEYPAVYAHFAALVARGDSDVDLRPLVHVADAFLTGRHHRADPFEWDRSQAI